MLLYKAQELARDRGYDPTPITCALLGICDGTECVLIERDKVKVESEWNKKMRLRKEKKRERMGR